MTSTENLKEVFKNYTYKAIFNQLGYEEYDMDDIATAKSLVEDIKCIQNNGAESGQHGFIYTEDIQQFYNDNSWRVDAFVDDWGCDDWFVWERLSDLLNTSDNTNFIEMAVYRFVEHYINKLDADNLIEEIEDEEE